MRMKNWTAFAAALGMSLLALPAMAGSECDVTGDGVLNDDDAAVIQAAIGTQEGDLDFVPSADLDGDGQVLVSDFTVFIECGEN